MPRDRGSSLRGAQRRSNPRAESADVNGAAFLASAGKRRTLAFMLNFGYPGCRLFTMAGASLSWIETQTIRGKSSEQKRRRAARLLPGLLIAATAWWGSGGVGLGQPADNVAAGRVEGGSDVLSLGTSATGTIAEFLVEAGAHVQAGQHLVRVECGNIERELEARKADLAAVEAALSRTVHGPPTRRNFHRNCQA